MVDTTLISGYNDLINKEKAMTIVLQKTGPGLYASDLINGQFQVIESTAIKSNFIIYDHKKDDILRNRDASTVYFPSADEAHAYIDGKSSVPKPVKTKPVKVKPEKVAKVKVEKAPAKARAITVGAVEVRARKERPGSMLSVIRALITKGGDDQAVYAELKANHPDTTYGLKTVAILRKEMGK
jgi:hypothetical protein